MRRAFSFLFAVGLLVGAVYLLCLDLFYPHATVSGSARILGKFFFMGVAWLALVPIGYGLISCLQIVSQNRIRSLRAAVN
jgi:hypothetical protein